MRSWSLLGLVAALGVMLALVLTRDRGPQPEMQAHLAGEPVAFQRLVMTTATEGWAIDEDGRILRAEEGPQEWREVGPEDLGQEDGARVAAAFLDGRRAWVAVGDGPGGAGRFRVYRTRNAGSEWERVGEIQVDERVAGEALGGVQLTFVDDAHGWFLGQIHPGMHRVEPFLFATEDGGASWRLVMTTLPSPEGQLPEHPLKGSYSLPYGSEVLAFVSPRRGLAGTGRLWLTTDGGASWLPVELPSPPDPPELAEPFTYARPPRFTSGEDGYVVVDLYPSEDVYCPPCDQFAASPQASYLYRTDDGGDSWVARKLPIPGGVVAFSDARHGWLLGREGREDGQGGRTVLHRTADGGETWQAVARELPIPPTARLDRLDEERGFAWDAEPPEGDGSALWTTANGGREWQAVEAHLVPAR